mmetsp:Transcript_21587/g.51544  ORF Transcript_21587/g.51544 Transcript_21587/m.51544 type:complete len:447 (-) Transcript_21587:63-1403(-)
MLSKQVRRRGSCSVSDAILVRETGNPSWFCRHSSLRTFSDEWFALRASTVSLAADIGRCSSGTPVGDSSSICCLTVDVQTATGMQPTPCVVLGSDRYHGLSLIALDTREEPSPFPCDGLGVVRGGTSLRPCLLRRYQLAFLSVTSTVPVPAGGGAGAGLVAATWLGAADVSGVLTLHRVSRGGSGAAGTALRAAPDIDRRRADLLRSDDHLAIAAHLSLRGSAWCCDARWDGGQVSVGTTKGTEVYDVQGEASRFLAAPEPSACLASRSSHVLSQAYCFEGRCLARGLRNGLVQLFDLRARQTPALSLKMRSSVTSLRALRSDHNCLLSAGLNGHITMWDLRTCGEARRYHGHRNSHKRFSLALPEAEGTLCAAGDDNRMRLWSARGGALLQELGPFPWHTAGACFCPGDWGDPSALWCATESGMALLACASSPLRGIQLVGPSTA